MKTRIVSLAAGGLVGLAGCASHPAPVQRMADAEATTRGAQEVGAGEAANPQAQLHLRMAQEEISVAKKLMDDGDNERADFTLLRAKSDAELALALAREAVAQRDAQNALRQVEQLRASTGSPGPASTTTTTSGTTTTTTNGGNK